MHVQGHRVRCDTLVKCFNDDPHLDLDPFSNLQSTGRSFIENKEEKNKKK